MPQEVIKKNHMDVAWHEYTDENGENVPVVDSSIAEKASVIGRVGIMFLSCGTGAWRVRSSMNTLAEALGITCTADIGLMSIEYTCYDGEEWLYPVTVPDQYRSKYLKVKPFGTLYPEL